MGTSEKKGHTSARGKRTRVVTIGGGTGSFVLLSGLKEYPLHISAIVSMADDGGSTGVLRDEMGVLPPGDVRQCLAALARAGDEVRALFSYRFTNNGLNGHNAGNLFLSALEKITGSFSKAVAVAGKILNVYGRVIPVTEEDMRLMVELNSGVTLEGEHKLDDDPLIHEHGVRSITLSHPVQATDDAIDALAHADVVVIGPGDTYGSVVPNLLVNGISEALHDTKAHIVVIANVTNKKGLTDGFATADYVKTVEHYLGGRAVDALLFNTQEPSAELKERYEAQEGAGMFVTHPDEKTSYVAIGCPFLDMNSTTHAPSLIRHDSDKLARAVVEYIHTYV